MTDSLEDEIIIIIDIEEHRLRYERAQEEYYAQIKNQIPIGATVDLVAGAMTAVAEIVLDALKSLEDPHDLPTPIVLDITDDQVMLVFRMPSGATVTCPVSARLVRAVNRVFLTPPARGQ